MALTEQVLRARLLEFLKFRVLAAQESFFDPFSKADGLDSESFRAWLAGCWPEALALADEDLKHVLSQAHRLYVN
jgi:hypothetical protein|tara:strand:- start:883 stop:1107 length:225 start_codon:yes stop_codon:yes gene_type:complete